MIKDPSVWIVSYILVIFVVIFLVREVTKLIHQVNHSINNTAVMRNCGNSLLVHSWNIVTLKLKTASTIGLVGYYGYITTVWFEYR